YAALEELTELANIASRYRGIYASHIRDEGEGLFPAVEEALTIGQICKIPVHISHLKSSGRAYWGNAGSLLSRLKQVRQQGQPVTADQYPYSASSTSLQATVIPPKYREGTQQEMVARFHDPLVGQAMREAVRQRIRECKDGSDIRIARYAPKPAWQGKDLATIARQEGRDPLSIVLEIETRGGAQIIHFSMSDEDMRLISREEFVATASDGGAKIPDDSMPHPRNYGTFARKIGRFAIEEKRFSLEQAVRSATGLPADILQLKERGYLKPDYYADLVLFDPDEFRDRSTFDAPHTYSTGVVYLFVNGKKVIDKSKFTGTLAGVALKRQ
ncbi:MAG TPA: amidohydrolase family protein, partial [Gemmatales bacterium]|nr:amidohydrolase family protein [Gemmatales bacterium]